MLRRVLKAAKGARASEVRFISGRPPMVRIQNSLHYFNEPELTAATVRDIHLACLTMAKGEIPTSKATFGYRIISDVLGQVRCMYTLRRGARTLVLIPEGEALATADVARGGKPPALRAEARVEESSPKKKQLDYGT